MKRDVKRDRKPAECLCVAGGGLGPGLFATVQPNLQLWNRYCRHSICNRPQWLVRVCVCLARVCLSGWMARWDAGSSGRCDEEWCVCQREAAQPSRTNFPVSACLEASFNSDWLCIISQGGVAIVRCWALSARQLQFFVFFFVSRWSKLSSNSRLSVHLQPDEQTPNWKIFSIEEDEGEKEALRRVKNKTNSESSGSRCDSPSLGLLLFHPFTISPHFISGFRLSVWPPAIAVGTEDTYRERRH